MRVVWPLVYYDASPYDKVPQVIGSFKRPGCLLWRLLLYKTGWIQYRFIRMKVAKNVK